MMRIRKYRLELLVALFGLSAINAIFVSTAFRDGRTIDRVAAAQLGDFVGGYVGAFFALLSTVFLFATLREQRKAAAESRYFELLRLHRDNVSEVRVGDVVGRKVFVLMLREFRAILEIVNEVSAGYRPLLDGRQALHIAYYCLYYGTGPNSSRMLKSSLSGFAAPFVDALEKRLDDDALKASVQGRLPLPYKPFEGHQSRLGHYYRHLYQSVCYVDSHASGDDKYEYVKTIRAQLSTHEQALLLLNSLTPLGKDWWTKRFMERYRMVQNLPRDFFDARGEIEVTSLFESPYFEWEEPGTVESGA